MKLRTNFRNFLVTTSIFATSFNLIAAPVNQHNFDVEAHRGGRGETTEESFKAFQKAAQQGVTTLELDVVMTKDNVPLVWHDSKILPEKCRDTTGNYVNQIVHDLSYEQIDTLYCDKKLTDFPTQKAVIGNKILKLHDMLKYFGTRYPKIRFNIETKIEADHPNYSPTPLTMVKAILEEIKQANLLNRVTIQSFDWRTFPLVKKMAPNIPLAMLWDKTTWKNNSPWIGNINYNRAKGNILVAAKQLGITLLSPEYTTTDKLKTTDKGFKLYTDKTFVNRAHQAGFKILPWTVNDLDAMRLVLTAGVDGIITDYPTRLQKLLKSTSK